ncbi:hypothetical protein FBEOM_70 [Fusarium beomiforme]|uniref:Uncharacterized protein n=1 Tax=Fusarium beomiforme TaxID=44412 RepID=A0A9P5E7N6_9HYPO|nr:hypothetical protein FBEOM_70 [Fusarium beomiforme]
MVIGKLPPDSLYVLLVCCRNLGDITLPRLLRTVRLTFAEKHIERLQAISVTYPRYVQEIVFIAAQTRDTHDDKWGKNVADNNHEEYAKDYRRKFLACIDSLPNLHTFTSELGPSSNTATKDNINGLVHAILPALCRLSSRITTHRCQDPLNYMRWFLSKFEPTKGPPEAMIKFIPKRGVGNICTCKDRRKNDEYILKLSGTGEVPCKGSLHLISKLIPLEENGITFHNSHFAASLSTPSLNDIRQLYDMSCFTTAVATAMSFASSNMQLLAQELIFIASSSFRHMRVNIGLNFLDETHSGGDFTDPKKPQIVPEKLVLDYINGKDPQQLYPFAAWKLSGYEYLGTVDQKAESISVKWPQNNGMAVDCGQCMRKG